MTTMTFNHNEIIVLCGPSSAGKTTFTNKFFPHVKALRSEEFRILLQDTNEKKTVPSQVEHDTDYERLDRVNYTDYGEVSEGAFSLMKEALKLRAKKNKLTVIDATNLLPSDIFSYITIAKEQHVPISLAFFKLPLETILEQNQKREQPESEIRIRKQYSSLKRIIRKFDSERKLKKYNVHKAHYINSLEELEVEVLENPFVIPLEQGLDVLGDGHGLLESRLQLFEKLGYVRSEDGLYRHPNNRKFVYLNDEASRGSLPVESEKYGKYPSIAMMVSMKRHVEEGLAYAVDSNHNFKIWQWLKGKQVQMQNGNETVVEEFEAFEQEYGEEKTSALKEELGLFLQSLPSHLIVEDRGVQRAVIVHGGIKDEYIGKDTLPIRDYCRFGDRKKREWKKEHRNKMLIVWGHEVHLASFEDNNTLNIDSGGYCGHFLTALRYPEMELVQEKVMKSFVPDEENPILQQQKKRFNPPSYTKFLEDFEVTTAHGKVFASKKYTKEALEFASTRMDRMEHAFYIPPTMSPTPTTSELADFLEHPKEAFEYYREKGVSHVVCQKKHMGSRAYITLYKTEEVAKEYTNIKTLGKILSRNSAPFFKKDVEEKVVKQLHEDLQPYFEKNQTDFILLDCEIMPWNLKSAGLIRAQYGLTSNVAIHTRELHIQRLQEFQENRNVLVTEELQDAEKKLDNAKRFHKAFTYYCWDSDVHKLEGIQIAPFHVLAFSKGANFNKTNEWHMKQAQELSTLSSLIVPTEYKLIDLDKEEEVEEATNWWLEMTKQGHEGMVMKPLDFLSYDENEELIQPAIKIRGREYLRIIYGMDYLEEENLGFHKTRSASKKMKNAIQEFTLSLESMTRFLQKDTVERVHEVIIAALSHANEPMDPRL